MATKSKSTDTKRTDSDYVQMYYEYQYDRISKHEDNRLTLTNYVLTISTLAFTFGYQNATQLTIINGIGLPVIVILLNIFALLYIERTKEFMDVHQDRARVILKLYAPELQRLNEEHIWRKGNFLHTKRGMHKGIHYLLVLVALMPLGLYIYQTIS